jgi:hypothetical protein
MTKYINGEDLKLKLAFLKDSLQIAPNQVPFDVKMWTIYPSQVCRASYDGTNYVNCLVRDNYLIIAIDNPKMASGLLHCELTLHYPDDEVADKIRDKVVCASFEAMNDCITASNIYIEGIFNLEIVGLSAYGVAVHNGFTGTEKEWLQTLVQPAKDAAKEATDKMKEFSETEIIRESNEDTRQSNEDTRKINETTRQSNEETRKSNESERQSSEEARLSNEIIRINNENIRLNNEKIRNSNEVVRENNESERKSNETTRQNNETKRQSNEETRKTNENARINSEEERKANETTRQNNEEARENETTELIKNVNDTLGKIYPTSVSLTYPSKITFGNKEEHKIKYTLSPTTVLQNILFIGDNNAVTVQPDGNVLVNKVGKSYINVIPTGNTAIYKTIIIEVVESGVIKKDENSIILLNNGNLLMN